MKIDVDVNVVPNRRLMREFADLEPGEALATALSVLACIAVGVEISTEAMCEHVRNAIRVATASPGTQ